MHHFVFEDPSEPALTGTSSSTSTGQVEALEEESPTAAMVDTASVSSALRAKTKDIFLSLTSMLSSTPGSEGGGLASIFPGRSGSKERSKEGQEELDVEPVVAYSSESRMVPTVSKGNSLMVVTKISQAVKAFKAPPVADGPTPEELTRGVQVEKVYDFWDVSTRRTRQRKMLDDVLHQRRTSVDMSPFDGPLDGATADAMSSSSSESSDSDRGEPSPRSKKGKGLLRRSFTMSNPELVGQWGALVGKVLHSKVLDFGELKDKAIRQRKIEDAGSPDSSANRMVRRLQERARIVVKQALHLGKRVCREADRYDGEWTDQSLLTHLFSTEYLDTLMLLTNVAVKLLGTQPMLAQAKAPCKIFGDIHGQLRDLLMFFMAFGNPLDDPNLSIVFNGDFVDRGAHQLEVIGLLFALKVLYPDRVWLVRGNHEDRTMNEKYGFHDSCVRLLGNEFGPKVFDLIQGAFNRLPVACLVEGKILCVHGGIGDGTWRLGDLRAIPRPLVTEYITDPANSWIFNILWSDPIEDGKGADPMIFGVHESPRGGVAAQFAWNITKTFCARNGLSLIVRSHQSKRGSRGFDVMHENLLMRVFSARDYEGHGNDGAILSVSLKKDVPVEGTEELRDILVVRPQVVRSVRKARDEELRRAAEEGRTPGDLSPLTPGKKSGRKRSTVR